MKMFKSFFSMLMTLCIILCSVFGSMISAEAAPEDEAVAAVLEYAHEKLDGKYDIDDSRAFGSKDGNYYNVYVFLANENWSYIINVESGSNKIISSLGNSDEENKAVSAAINAAYTEYGAEYKVIDHSAHIFEANDSCYMILVYLEDAMFVPVFIVQKGVNKVVYSSGLQDCWVGMLDDTYMSRVTLETTENISANSADTSVSTASDITLIINGEAVETEVKPYIDNGTTMVPIRGVFEALGADVAYDAETKTVIITAEEKGKTISLPVGSSSASVNGETVSLQNSAVIVNGSTMVPLRFVAEALDADVDWNGDTKTVTITD